MKKSIILGNGNVKFMEFNNEFLNMYRGLAKKTFAEMKKKLISEITEDELQELDIIIYKSFKKYDEIHAFSTLLTWEVKSYTMKNIKNETAKKRSRVDVKIVSLDAEIDEEKGENLIYNLVADNNVNIALETEDSELLKYISNKCNDTEKAILLALLDKISYGQVAKITNKSSGNVTNHKNRLIKKLNLWISNYNKLAF